MPPPAMCDKVIAGTREAATVMKFTVTVKTSDEIGGDAVIDSHEASLA
jgi:hypothetical protein